MIPAGLPPLNLNMATSSASGDIDAARRSAYNFGAPVINKGMNPYLIAGGVVVIGAAIYFRGR